MEITRRLLVPYSAERMFDLIEAAERYPEFMPWCARATIVERSADVVVADIDVDYRGVRFEFRTRNPKRRPAWMAIRLERGPFRRFEGEWRLTPLGEAGCRIEFEMRYDFNSVMARLAGPVFDRITNAMVDAYVARADVLFAGEPAGAPGTAAADPAAPAVTNLPPPAPTAPATPAAEPVAATPAERGDVPDAPPNPDR
jgi:ribosome-associated toxin RatA of RatAB toxin-antitoxin module